MIPETFCLVNFAFLHLVETKFWAFTLNQPILKLQFVFGLAQLVQTDDSSTETLRSVSQIAFPV